MTDTLSLLKRFLGRIAEFLFGWYFRLQIKRFDLLFAGTMDLVNYGKTIRKDSFWLPIGVPKIKSLGKKNKLFTVFIPTRFDKIKGIERVLPLLDVVSRVKKNYQVIIIAWGTEKWVRDEIIKRHKNVKVIPHIKDRKRYYELLTSADVVFGQFHKGTSVCGQIERETMMAKVPLISLDKYDSRILRQYYNDLEVLVEKVITDEKFRKEFVDSNYKDITRNHDMKKIKRLLLSNIQKVRKEKRYAS
jgi:hypothetical protein